MLLLLIITGLIMASPEPLSVSPGSPALVFELPAVNPSAALRAVNKDRISLTDVTGVLPTHPKRGVVLHFFSLTDSDKALKALDKLHQRYKNKDVLVLGICVSRGGLAQASSWVEARGLRFPVLHDPHGIVTTRYGVTQPPITVVVDAAGRIFAIGKPASGEVEKEIAAELDGLLAS